MFKRIQNQYEMEWKAILNDFQPMSDGLKTRAAELYCSIVIKRTMERTMLWIVEFVLLAYNIVDNHAQHVVVATAAATASVNAIKVNITTVKSLKRRKQQQKCLWQINRIGEQKRKKRTHTYKCDLTNATVLKLYGNQANWSNEVIWKLNTI